MNEQQVHERGLQMRNLRTHARAELAKLTEAGIGDKAKKISIEAMKKQYPTVYRLACVCEDFAGDDPEALLKDMEKELSK